MLDNTIVIDSPIEFALIGPSKGRDKLLIKSRNAGMDLVGLARVAMDTDDKEPESESILNLLFNINSVKFVRSIPVSDARPEFDSRKSEYIFAWKGFASSNGVNRVRKALNLNAQELRAAIASSDSEHAEWSIASLIYLCAAANDYRLRFRRVIVASLISYVALILLGLVIALAGLAFSGLLAHTKSLTQKLLAVMRAS
jgi:hypothetical protein